MSAGCIIAVASVLPAEDDLEGRTRRHVCQHEGDVEKRIESEGHVGRAVEKYRRSMSKCVALLRRQSARMV
jgi:hypothetical protein